MWYFQSHLTCDKLGQSCIDNSSYLAPLGISRGNDLYFSHRIVRTSSGPVPEVEDLDPIKPHHVVSKLKEPSPSSSIASNHTTRVHCLMFLGSDLKLLRLYLVNTYIFFTTFQVTNKYVMHLNKSPVHCVKDDTQKYKTERQQH